MIILYCSLIFGCLWMGVLQAKKLQSRQKFYENFMGFLRAYERNLSFSQKEFKVVVEDYLKEIEDAEFTSFLTATMLGENIKIEYLSDGENYEIKNMLQSLGRTDEVTEMKLLQSASSVVECRVKQSQAKTEKYSSFSIKLGLLVGVLLVILLL